MKDRNRLKKTYSFFPSDSFRLRKTYSHSRTKPVPAAAYHDMKYSPSALYQFNGNLNDSTANNFTLFPVTGSITYQRMFKSLPGIGTGIGFDGVSGLACLTQATVHQNSGSLTVEAICNLSPSTTTQTIATVGGGAGDIDGSENYLWRLAIDSSANFQYFAEHGIGVDIIFSTSTTKVSYGKLQHIAMTRSSVGDVRFYINGLFTEGSSGLALPDSNSRVSTAQLQVGYSQNVSLGSVVVPLVLGSSISSLKIINSQLSDDQILDEFHRSIGPLF
jgi:hypothetical protein